MLGEVGFVLWGGNSRKLGPGEAGLLAENGWKEARGEGTGLGGGSQSPNLCNKTPGWGLL